MQVAIFTSPLAEKGFFVTQALQKADKIFAADCGANVALSWGITLDAVIGDFDSIEKKTLQSLEKTQVKRVVTPPEKDETDTQLAVDYAIAQGATEISLIGGVQGDRIEHTIANVTLTYNPKIPVEIVNGPSKLWVILGPQTVSITGKANDLLSLLPLSQIVTHIRTEGLYYPLLDEPLYFGKPRGISNIFAAQKATVSFENGMLLFVQTTRET